MSNRKMLSATTDPLIIYFSYSQIHVFDSSVELSGCEWTDAHSKQGFARRSQVVNFSTLLEFGDAEVVVRAGPYEDDSRHERVIRVPLEVSSGKVVIAGPEEYPNERIIELPEGSYSLVAAQRVTDDEREAIDLYFEKLTKPLDKSAILRADEKLKPPSPLLENSEVA